MAGQSVIELDPGSTEQVLRLADLASLLAVGNVDFGAAEVHAVGNLHVGCQAGDYPGVDCLALPAHEGEESQIADQHMS